MKTSLPQSLAATVKSTIAEWQSGGKVKRLWDRDASLWTGEDESKWLGWLALVEKQEKDLKSGLAALPGGREQSRLI